MSTLATKGRAVQVSFDSELMGRIEADPEAKDRGRSAFIRSAVRHYLESKERRGRETASLFRAYDGEAEGLLSEVEDLLGSQTWPRD